MTTHLISIERQQDTALFDVTITSDGVYYATTFTVDDVGEPTVINSADFWNKLPSKMPVFVQVCKLVGRIYDGETIEFPIELKEVW